MTPLEHAARAIEPAAFREPDPSIPGDARLLANRQRLATKRARAVIEAIREPSSIMTRAAQAESHVSGGCEVDYHGIWASMIDALMEEG